MRSEQNKCAQMHYERQNESKTDSRRARQFAPRKWQFESDTDEEEEEFVGFESNNKGERVADKAILGLFVSDTEEDDDTEISG